MRKGMFLKILMGMAFCFLCLVGQKTETKADVIWFPTADEFYRGHGDECDEQWDLYEGRSYEVTAEAVELYNKPEGELIEGGLTVGKKARIYYVYENKETTEKWGCIGVNCWVSLRKMKLIYDHTEFMKDHKAELYKNTGQVNEYDITYPFNLYHYPGSGEVVQTIENGRIHNVDMSMYEHLEECSLYTDENGKVWAFLHSYCCGYMRGWVCLSDFEKLREPWVLRDEERLNLDYEEGLTMSDAKLVLKAALGIEYPWREYSLDDAQLCLEYALGIR